MEIGIVGIPTFYGSGIGGSDLGAFALRHLGLKQRIEKQGLSVKDFGNISVPNDPEVSTGDAKYRYAEVVYQVATNTLPVVQKIIDEGYFPLVLGGDHSASIGTIAEIARHYQDVFLLSFDAHGDFHTSLSTMSGNIHGMHMAIHAGLDKGILNNVGNYSPKIPAKNMAIIGARSIEPNELQSIHEHHVNLIPIDEIDNDGINLAMTKLLDKIKEDQPVYITFDMDVLDPSVASGVSHKVPGGLTYREAQRALEIITERRRVIGFELMEVNPLLDRENSTAQVGCDLIQSVFGTRMSWCHM